MEIDRVDILILFRRVFRVFDGAIGAMEKPLGMFANIGVVGGALNREVECDLDAAIASLTDEPG
jgi:hypothetical protein